MDEFELKDRINSYIKEISHYSQMQIFANSYYQKNYFQTLIDEAVSSLMELYTGKGHWSYQESLSTLQLSNPQLLNPQLPNPQLSNSQLPNLQLPNLPIPNTQLQSTQLPNTQMHNQPERSFTIQELNGYDGSDGKPAYVAVGGQVYDVSNLIGWAGGTHFGMYAGKDLNDIFMNCHHGMVEILKNVPQVGTLSV